MKNTIGTSVKKVRGAREDFLYIQTLRYLTVYVYIDIKSFIVIDDVLTNRLHEPHLIARLKLVKDIELQTDMEVYCRTCKMQLAYTLLRGIDHCPASVCIEKLSTKPYHQVQEEIVQLGLYIRSYLLPDLIFTQQFYELVKEKHFL